MPKNRPHTILTEDERARPDPAGMIWLHQMSPADRELTGGKAARLGELERAGFRVPRGFCIPAAAYRQHVLEADPRRFKELVEQRDFAQLRAWILEQEIEAKVKQAILKEYQALIGGARLGLAVRSSSTAEDMAQHSFAGLYASFLEIKTETQLLKAIRRCWASFWSDEAVAYRDRAGIDHAAHSMAVLVQAMAPAVVAGVMFTRISERSPEIGLIEFTREDGESLMGGEMQANRLYVDRRTGQPVRYGRPDGELDVSRLLMLGFQIEELMGAPQDIEWVMDAAGELWILQTRPVTSLLYAQFGMRGAGGDEWLLTYDEPFSPLGCQIAIERYRYWVKGINASLKTRFQPEIQDRDGLLYYRPTWRRANLPLKVWMNFWRLAAVLKSERTYRAYINEILPAYKERLQAIEGTNHAEESGPALLRQLRETIQLYLDFQYTSYAIGAAATLSAGLLDLACRFLFGKKTRWNALDFLTGLEDVSIRRELEVYRLGQMLKPHLPSASPAHPGYAELEALKQGGEPSGPFWQAAEGFLQEYGYLWADRYPRDPAWEFNQEAFAASLWIAAQATPEESLEIRHRKQRQRREEAINQAMIALEREGSLPGGKFIFSRLLRRAEKLFPFKEDRNHYTYRGAMVIRQLLREIGSRLQVRQLLPAAEDIFFLKVDEIETLWHNPRVASWLLNKVTQRKEVYLRSRRSVQQRSTLADQPGRGEQNETLVVQGDPCSPGLAKGPARVISGPGELQHVRPGEIIVCTQLRPAWSAVFSVAGGVVIEMGSLLSHGSTLAREYGIPAVINVGGITGLVRDHDWLVVDGNLGKVTIERHPVAQADAPPAKADRSWNGRRGMESE